MRRTIVLVGSPLDAEWTHRAAMRLSQEHDVRRVSLAHEDVAALTASPGRIDLFVLVLGHGLVQDPQARPLFEVIRGSLVVPWLIVIKDRSLERSIPPFLAHMHALVPRGDPIAALIAELSPVRARAAAPRAGVSVVVVSMMALAAFVLVGIGVAVTVAPRWLEPVMEEIETVHSSERSTLGGPTEGGEEILAEPRAVDDLGDDTPASTSSGIAAEPPSLSPKPGIGEPAMRQERPFRIPKGPWFSLVYLQGGTFRMGDVKAKDPQDRRLREASVSGFWMGRTEVTQALWTSVMESNPSEPMAGAGDEYPVQVVSWEETIEFLNRLSARCGRIPCYARGVDGRWQWDDSCNGFRLPTEAEWEYAARAGSTSRFFFGDWQGQVCKYGNVADSSAAARHSFNTYSGCDDGYPELAPVAKLEPSPWMLYDIIGNVREIVWDRYAPLPDPVPLDYRGPDEGDQHLARGGAYSLRPFSARAGGRFHMGKGYRERNLGLRLAMSGPRIGPANAPSASEAGPP